MLEINYEATSDLIPYVNNSRTHEEYQVDQIAASIKEFGFTNPVLIDEKGGIIAGHGRLLAARKLELQEVPTIMLKGLSEAQKKAYIIADNKLALNAGWNNDLLKLELEHLKEVDFDIDLIGFDESELNAIFGIEVDDDDDNQYTQKADTPLYEPSEEKPELAELFDDSYTQKLIKKIQDANIPEDEKHFLLLAAGRHTVLNFEQIADYYAHSDYELQNLMEDNALVIVDLNKAIENGWANLSEELAEQYSNDNPEGV